MIENENKITNKGYSIDKDKLFAQCYWERDIAKVGITMLLVRNLKVKPMEAYSKALQLKAERESFYSLI